VLARQTSAPEAAEFSKLKRVRNSERRTNPKGYGIDDSAREYSGATYSIALPEGGTRENSFFFPLGGDLAFLRMMKIGY
jgi:hypothetical protein